MIYIYSALNLHVQNIFSRRVNGIHLSTRILLEYNIQLRALSLTVQLV